MLISVSSDPYICQEGLDTDRCYTQLCGARSKSIVFLGNKVPGTSNNMERGKTFMTVETAKRA